MKGNEKLVARLNRLLAEELAAINQYVVHSEMCENWGYERLHEATRKRAVQEMKHAEALIRRILFLGGTPIVSQLAPLHIGADVKAQIENDLAAERLAIQSYNEAIREARESGDDGTRQLLSAFVHDEEGDLEFLEAQLAQIEQMGLENYLAARG